MTTMSSEAWCQCERKTKTWQVVIVFRCLRHSSLPHECNKWLNSEIRLNTVNDISLIFVYHMCENWSWRTYEMHLVSLRKTGVTLSGKPSTLLLGVERRGCCVQGTWRPSSLVETTSRWPRSLASAFVVDPKWQVKLALGETWWPGNNNTLVWSASKTWSGVAKCLPIPWHKSCVKSFHISYLKSLCAFHRVISW
jgi:hypothetical protein